MSRAKWKGPSITLQLLDIKNNEIVTKSRGITIIPKFIGLDFKIYNGKTYTQLSITEKMVGHKLGEFSPTRSFRGHAGAKNKGKK